MEEIDPRAEKPPVLNLHHDRDAEVIGDRGVRDGAGVACVRSSKRQQDGSGRCRPGADPRRAPARGTVLDRRLRRRARAPPRPQGLALLARAARRSRSGPPRPGDRPRGRGDVVGGERCRRAPGLTARGKRPVLDATGKETFRRRLHELAEELEEAKAWNDPERATRAELEIEALTTELEQGLGLGGRDRGLSSPAERARVSVTKALRAAVRAISKDCPGLGEHLRVSVRTGRFCSYAPPGQTPPAWNT